MSKEERIARKLAKKVGMYLMREAIRMLFGDDVVNIELSDENSEDLIVTYKDGSKKLFENGAEELDIIIFQTVELLPYECTLKAFRKVMVK
jgi:hypothetical protein